MPPFNFGDPQLWFIMAEATFQLAIPKPITASATKYNYCVAHLSPEAAAIVRDSGGLARLPACPMASGPLKQKTIWAPQKVWQRSKEELLLSNT
ncbi:hypothetical protein AVEN_30814-1 [Araneus ventricosus]|uniref:DUF7041 domain-containing protein n=1 Tax=Araneus ventricosus TaxID=182803 RepID=A0A4Y2KTC7_ARAVE|nr:hypothetical protein AVEN_30814-1 [Araneus ventricosus]